MRSGPGPLFVIAEEVRRQQSPLAACGLDAELKSLRDNAWLGNYTQDTAEKCPTGWMDMRGADGALTAG